MMKVPTFNKFIDNDKMLYNWTYEKILGVITFCAATLGSSKKEVIDKVMYDPQTFDILNTIIKGAINSIFAISVALIIHWARVKYIDNNRKNKK